MSATGALQGFMTRKRVRAQFETGSVDHSHDPHKQNAAGSSSAPQEASAAKRPRQRRRPGGRLFERVFFGMNTEWRIATAFVELGSPDVATDEVRGVFCNALGEGNFDSTAIDGGLLLMQACRKLAISDHGRNVRLHRSIYAKAQSAIAGAVHLLARS